MNSWGFNDSHLWKPEFFSTKRNLIFFIKNPRNNHSSASGWWEYTKSCFKGNARAFPKNATNQENSRVLRLKKRTTKLIQKRNFRQEIKRMIENLKDQLYQLGK